MKKETIGIIMLATVGLIGLGAMLLGRDWEYERGVKKPEIQDGWVDSVSWDSSKRELSIWRNDTLTIYNSVFSYYPENLPIDWNWFKKGYVPKDIWFDIPGADTIGVLISVNGRSGPNIIDTINNLTR